MLIYPSASSKTLTFSYKSRAKNLEGFTSIIGAFFMYQKQPSKWLKNYISFLKNSKNKINLLKSDNLSKDII